MFTHLTLKSRNVKTGPIPVSTTAAESCPSACPFNTSNAGGCYAESGPLALHWRKVSDGRAGESFNRFLEKIRALPIGQLWRHNQAGDLLGKDNEIDVAALRALVDANKGKRGFTYTHKPMTPENMQAVADAVADGFTVNLSGNNIDHADSLAGLNIAPVVTVLPIEYQRKETKGEWQETETEYRNRLKTLAQETRSGRKVRVCPATYKDNVSCASCKLCAVVQRDVIVGFPAHGTTKKRADAIATA